MNKVKNVINIKYYDSPCGGMIIGAVGKGLCLCDWRENRHRLHNDNRVKCFFNAVYEEKDSRLLHCANSMNILRDGAENSIFRYVRRGQIFNYVCGRR